jgi:phenylacetic acid degradation operon negative regulatory protein
LSNALAGFEEYQHRFRHDNLIRRLEADNLVARSGRGKKAVFSLTEHGHRRVHVPDPSAHWKRGWDGLWRVVTFDLPETQRKDRVQLWKALRAHRLGLLQRSVWIWPDELEPVLNDIVRVEGIPECFCGFEARRLFLCSHQEIVATAWDWEEIGRRQDGYLKSVSATGRVLDKIRDLPRLAAEARSERQAFEYAMEFDPLLPRELWPKGYVGSKVWEEHTRFRQRLRQAFPRLQPAPAARDTNPVKQGNDRFLVSPDSGKGRTT